MKERVSPRREGFVLVMVLVMVTLAAISLAGLARRSLVLVRQVTTAQEDLQRRWGVISCRRALLDQAEQFLDQGWDRLQPEYQIWPAPAAVGGEFTLGRLSFEIRLADEDAKVNLNTVYRHTPNRVNQAVTDLLHAQGTGGLVTRIVLPIGNKTRSPFQSWGQVFEFTGSVANSEVARRLHDATSEMTCWGSGRLNLRRASNESVRVACENEIPQNVVRKLLALRGEPDLKDVEDLLRRLSLKGSRRLALQRLVTDESHCHSLWIHVDNSRRTWTTFVVDRSNRGHGADQRTFRW